ncbi:MAG: hypothetical protein WC179_06675 [Candidatus Cloacimonadaceae bacterium]
MRFLNMFGIRKGLTIGFNVEIRDRVTGKLLHRGHNIVTTAGRSALVDLLQDHTAVAEFAYIAIGTGAGVESPDDEALTTEIDRVLATQGEPIGQPTVYQLTATWTNNTASTQGITEIGILNDDVAGTLLARETFAVLNIPPDGQIDITWTMPLTAA